MGKLLTHLFISFLFSSLLTACDSDLVERGERYVGRMTHGVMDKLQSNVSKGRESINVSTLLPPPNYSNADASDAKQLTDASLTMPPMWSRPESVGWEGKTPVLIEVKRSGAGVTSGKVRVHAALGAYAGVQLPRQIDVYTKVEGGVSLVGSYREKQGLSLQDKRSYWLEVPVRGLTETFVVAVHASGWYVQLDEVEFVADANTNQSTVNTKVLALNSLEEIQKSASEKLILDMEMRASDRFASKKIWREKHPKQPIVSWVADPWAVDLDQLSPSDIDSSASRVHVEGTNDEFEHFAIGVYSTQSGLSNIDIAVEGLPDGSFELLSLERVLASDGRMAFDPLVPVKNATLKIQSGWPYHLWVKLNLRKMPIGSHSATVSVTNKTNTFSQNYAVSIDVVDAGKSRNIPLRASVWGYSRDMPMWADPQLAVQNQQAHYVNRWTIHPESIPGLALDGKSEEHKKQRLLADLELYKGRGKVRLYLGWTLESNPLGMKAQHYTISPTREKAFVSWLMTLKGLMESAGFGAEDWELYPIDEPTGPLLDALLPVSTIIKRTLPQIAVYADPISTTAQPSKESQLTALDATVDSWQPDLALMQGKGQSFFAGLNKDWGFYQNPPLPPKRANPIRYYRALGWWAWKTGATGVGFWSFSDTTSSSMWNDFDGRRPDFSVVYDRSGVLFNSRRWEAFAEGIEDYKIMQGASVKPGPELDPAMFNTQTIQALRSTALQQLK